MPTAFYPEASPQDRAAGATTATASAALLRQLAGQDAVLGPSVPGRDPLEDALAGFAGAPGGPPLHPWEAGLAPRSAPGACRQHAAPCIGALQGPVCMGTSKQLALVLACGAAMLKWQCG